MKTRNLAVVLVLTLAAVLIQVPSAFAKKGGNNGGGKGQTKIDFSLTLGDPTSSRILAKRDVADGVAQLPEVGSSSKNDNLANQIVGVFVGDSLTTGTADSKGRVRAPLDAKLTANGRLMQVRLNGLDLETLMGLSTVDGTFATIVPIVITTTYVDPVTLLPVLVILSDEMVSFTYTVSRGKVRGRNF